MQRTPTHPRLHELHRAVGPWLLAFLARPLSDSGKEADGPGFLCTNQGGICSLTDTSPLTRVSSHIHYSSSARWAALVEGASSVSAASSIPAFNCLSVFSRKRQTSCSISSKRLRPVSWLYCLSSHNFCVLHFCPVWKQRGANHLDGISRRTAKFEEAGEQIGPLGAPLRSDERYLRSWNNLLSL